MSGRDTMSTNKLIITGKLTKDAYIASGFKDSGTWTKCTLTLLVETPTQGKTAYVEKLYIDCIVWNNEAARYQHLKEGELLTVEGRLKSESWKDKDGNSKSKFVIVPSKIIVAQEVKEEVKDFKVEVPKQKYVNKIWDSAVDNDDLPF